MRPEHQAQELGHEARGLLEVLFLRDAVIDGLREEEGAGDGELLGVLRCGRHQLLNLVPFSRVSLART
ncbi:hypothetical protein D3C87_1927350 [compost metagenome]